jgi:hypothetical protein
MKNIYELKLHKAAIVHDNNLFITALRVPGGWIYNSFDKSNSVMGSAFVPFHNEFMWGVKE